MKSRFSLENRYIIQISRLSKEELEEYHGEYNELILDTTNWKIKTISREKNTWEYLSGRQLFSIYKDSGIFIRNHKFFHGIKSVLRVKFLSLSESINNRFVGVEGEVVEILGKKRLVVHDGKIEGGHKL